jgi:hypothetical protein
VTDVVACGKPTDKEFPHVMVPWEIAFAKIGHRMAVTSEDPTRYEIQGALTADEWAALSAANVR